MQNSEYTALVNCTAELALEIAVDPLAVSERLVAEGLIPTSLHDTLQYVQTSEKEGKAYEIVHSVSNKVKVSPNKLKVFLDVLGEFPWLSDVVQLIHEKKDFKVKKQVMCKSNRNETTSPLRPPHHVLFQLSVSQTTL